MEGFRFSAPSTLQVRAKLSPAILESLVLLLIWMDIEGAEKKEKRLTDRNNYITLGDVLFTRISMGCDKRVSPLVTARHEYEPL